jgi:hypothetical protein
MLQFQLSIKFWKYSIGPLAVLSEDEERMLVKVITECSQKGFPKS